MATKYRVLIVDDDESLREMYAAKFTAEGFEVLKAADGAEALAVVKAKKPQAIMLDIMMPKLDGFATLKQLKADKTLAKIPVVMASNLGQEEDMKKGKELGAEDYFVKSNQSPAEVVEKVRKLLKG